jgi:translation initiation factor IF-1
MPKEETIEVEGTVKEALPNATFKVVLDNGQSHRPCFGTNAGHFIRIVPGDRVKVELSPYDPTRGRIVYRIK